MQSQACLKGHGIPHPGHTCIGIDIIHTGLIDTHASVLTLMVMHCIGTDTIWSAPRMASSRWPLQH
eukprot:1155772-Pelagomonas_calceolata.AAC.3